MDSQVCDVVGLIRRPTMRAPLGSTSAVHAFPLAAALCWTFPAAAEQAVPPAQLAEVRVGIDEGDIRGGDHRALQSAVDYVAGLGGGTVHVGPGRYLMRGALT